MPERSAPAQNAFSPAPVRTTTRVPPSIFAAAIAARSSESTAHDSALWTSGRLIVSVVTPSAVSTSTAGAAAIGRTIRSARMGVFVIGCYRPKPGKAAELDAVAADHIPVLRVAGLVTDRESVLLRAADGTLVEVFEWRSKEAIATAHEHPDVLALWARYDACCDY